MAEAIHITQTCDACPSQWEGRLADGRYFYSRYRGGIISIGLDTNLEDARTAMSYQDTIGDRLDGYIDEKEMLAYLDLALLLNL